MIQSFFVMAIVDALGCIGTFLRAAAAQAHNVF